MLKLQVAQNVSGGGVLDADIGADGRLAAIIRESETCALIVDGETWHAWSASRMPHLRHVRWIDGFDIAIWSLPADPDGAVLACTPSARRVLPIGFPKDVMFGFGHCYACFGEDQVLRSPDGDIDAQMVAVFDAGFRLVFGLADVVNDRTTPDSPLEAQAGCVTQAGEAFLMFAGSNFLWKVDPSAQSAKRLVRIDKTNRFVALAENQGQIFCAIAAATGLLFGHIDTSSGFLTSLGEVDYSKLDELAALDRYDPSCIRVHGCANGSIVVSTAHVIWCASFAER